MGFTALRLVDEHDCGADTQRAEDVEYGEVEVELGECKHAVVGAEVEALNDVLDGVGRARMSDLNAFGRSSGARGVDDVGERVARSWQRSRQGLETFPIERLMNREMRSAAFDDLEPPGRRLLDTDGDVGSAGGEDAQ